jgi:hypothetical protein
VETETETSYYSEDEVTVLTSFDGLYNVEIDDETAVEAPFIGEHYARGAVRPGSEVVVWLKSRMPNYKTTRYQARKIMILDAGLNGGLKNFAAEPADEPEPDEDEKEEEPAVSGDIIVNIVFYDRIVSDGTPNVKGILPSYQGTGDPAALKFLTISLTAFIKSRLIQTTVLSRFPMIHTVTANI